jgi:hypothetical protein
MGIEREIKTWGQLRKLKVVDTGDKRYKVDTLGDFLDLGEFDVPHGRKEFKIQDLYKVNRLLDSQGIVLERDTYVDVNVASLLVDWINKLEGFLKSKGLLATSIDCRLNVNVGLEGRVHPRELSGNELVTLVSLVMNIKDDLGNEVTSYYYFQFLGRDSRTLQSLVAGYIRSSYWYDDYVTVLYEDVLMNLLRDYDSRLQSGKPVSRLVDALEDELLRLNRLSSKKVVTKTR